MGAYFPSRYEDVRAIAYDTEHFSSRRVVVRETRQPFPPAPPITSDPPAHRPAATNVAQVVLSGTVRHTPDGVVSMPAFGASYSDADIAAVVNYVTARFGAAPSNLTDKDVAQLRGETVR
jgi:hypothetical protein